MLIKRRHRPLHFRQGSKIPDHVKLIRMRDRFPHSMLGQTDRYSPTPDQIKSTAPRFNTFYRPKKDRTIYVVQIANVARKAAGLPADQTNETVEAIAASSWNKSHIKYAPTGYESYGIQGPQFNKRYSSDPLATVGSGNEYPVLWVTDPDDPKEPEDVYGTPVAPSPEPVPPSAPGTGPQGPPGRAPTSAEIQAEVDQWLSLHPPAAGAPGQPGAAGQPGPPPTAQTVQREVKIWSTANPPAPGQRGAKGDPGGPGPPGAPGDASEEAIAAAVTKHLELYPSSAGAPGARGEMGPQGLPGSPATAEQIAKQVDVWLTANPPPAGAPGQPGSSGGEGAPATLSQERLEQAIADALADRPAGAGVPGARGDPGAPGRPPTDGEIEEAVADFMAEHPYAGPTAPAGAPQKSGMGAIVMVPALAAIASVFRG